MRDRIIELNPNIHLYNVNGDDYLAFLQWRRYQKPSHPQPSKIPQPDGTELQESFTEQNANQSLVGQVRSGQSSQGKDSIGKVSAVQGDFKEFFGNENDLTDCLTTALTENISAGRARAGTQEGMNQDTSVRMNWGIQILKKCWKDCLGEEMPTAIFEGARHALRDIPIPIVAKAFAKAMSYQCGKHKSWKYIQKIIDEEMRKGKP